MDYNTLYLLTRCAKEYCHSRVRQIGVSDTEHILCSFLYFHKGVSQENVSKTLKLDKTTVSRALLSLENKGMIERIQNPSNRRKNILNVTKKGEASISNVIEIYDDWLNKVQSVFTDDEKEMFHALCEKLLRNAEIIDRELHSVSFDTKNVSSQQQLK